MARRDGSKIDDGDRPVKIDYNESPIVWFFVLEMARKRGNFERAANAQKELRRLGIEVRYRRPAATQRGATR
jgi:hypothetical protein